MNYIISGIGKAFCDGIEEALKPGVMHICPKGSEHSIVNILDNFDSILETHTSGNV